MGRIFAFGVLFSLNVVSFSAYGQDHAEGVGTEDFARRMGCPKISTASNIRCVMIPNQGCREICFSNEIYTYSAAQQFCMNNGMSPATSADIMTVGINAISTLPSFSWTSDMVLAPVFRVGAFRTRIVGSAWKTTSFSRHGVRYTTPCGENGDCLNHAACVRAG